MSETEVAQALEELQAIERIIADLQARLLSIQRSMAEHEEAVKLIEEIRKSGGRMKILVPLGAGSFAEANLESVEKVTVNLGAGIYAVKALEDTQQLLTKRSQALQAYGDTLSKRAAEYAARAEELRRFLNRVFAAQQRQG
ncbi:MAG: prefoldin subunit alpha [Candidatus Caldarchaeum sp.]|nr:prefoldin subunit alpha [Candidatus Caldarchaeum sp.]